MKKFYLIFVAILFITTIYGQAPSSFKYQAVARNASGQLITNTQVNIQIALLKGSISGSSVYTETFTPTTNNFGLVNLNIGTGTVVSGSFGTIDWGVESYFINIWLNGSEMGTSQLLSVPYALYAKKAETVANITITGSENAFTGWDKNASDDFDGKYNSLTGKPSLSTVATTGEYVDLSNKPILFDSSWSSLTGKPTFATVATTGSFTDLTNTPNLFDGSWTNLTDKPSFSTVAISGSYNDLINKPLLFDGVWDSITEKPTTIAGYGITDAFDGTWASLSGKPTFATIATSGEYSDLANLPKLFNGNYDSLSNKPSLFSGSYIDLTEKPTLFDGSWTSLTSKPTTIAGYGITDAFDGSWANLSDKPLFASVATSGDYTDLNNKPIIDGSETVLSAGANVSITGSGSNESPYIINSTVGGIGFTHYLGELYDNGIIFCIYKGNDGLEHGLIVALSEQQSTKWQNTEVTTNANRTWDGQYNMNLMSDSPAKNYVSTLGLGWYLPSIDELSILWHNRFYVNKALHESGNTLLDRQAPYWSSTEISATSAWSFYFGTGFTDVYFTKTYGCSVRAVRAF